ncbi:MAG: hypothetical protein JSS82_19635 [Bacteroidetes bacterium]|nr:hypothetical protein [Bacteroidota bacterium]
MKNYWKAAGLVALGALVMYYPAMRLYKYVAAKSKEAAEGMEEEGHLVKHLFQHKKHKANHRAAANGNLS